MAVATFLLQKLNQTYNMLAKRIQGKQFKGIHVCLIAKLFILLYLFIRKIILGTMRKILLPISSKRQLGEFSEKQPHLLSALILLHHFRSYTLESQTLDYKLAGKPF